MTADNTGPASIRGARRRGVDVANVELVSTSFLPGVEGETPLVVSPGRTGVDLPAWAGAHRDQVEQWLGRHGAILFRGFGLSQVEEFEAVASSICPDLFGDYGDLPREGESKRIYQSTPYPNDMAILFHNESSHLPRFPLRQFFFSVVVAEEGGATPVLDCRKVLELLDPAILEKFERKGLTYVRNFVPGVDVSWQDFFKTDDRSVVERTCAESGMTCEWTAAGNLRVKNTTPAVVVHPKTGDRVFFNQVQLHHVSALEPDVREALLSIVGEEDLPRNCYFGDGSPISDEEMAHLNDVFWKASVAFPWQVGDILMLDNMLIAHARSPFRGARKIVVAMSEMTGRENLVSSN